MNSLDDESLKLIFKELNLNERTSIRLVNKRFKELCDSILITKLIVFENKPPKAGKLEYTNELYTELDCVYVENLTKFFDNLIIQNQLKSLRILKILALDYPNNFKLTIEFDNLIYLSLDNLYLTEFKVFKSPKIEYLIIGNAFYDTNENAELIYNSLDKKVEINMFLTGFMYLKSKNLKYIKMNSMNDKNFFIQLLNNNLINNLEHLECTLFDFDTLEYINKSFTNLKRIDCLIKHDLSLFIAETKKIDLKKIANNLRTNLEVYIFGVLFNKSSVNFMIRFLSNLLLFDKDFILTRNSSRIIYEFGKRSFKLLKNNDNNLNLKEFHKLFTSIYLYGSNLFDKNLLEKFVNCFDVCIYLSNESKSSKYIQKLIQIYKLDQIFIFLGDLNSCLDNKILDLIPKYQNQIELLGFESLEKIDFNFLFKLTKLTYLNLILLYPFDQIVFLNLIKQNKYLQYISIKYLKTDDITKEYLINFKRTVIQYYEEETNFKNFDFFIEIHKKDDLRFIRLCLILRSNLQVTYYRKQMPEPFKSNCFKIYNYVKINNKI